MSSVSTASTPSTASDALERLANSSTLESESERAVTEQFGLTSSDPATPWFNTSSWLAGPLGREGGSAEGRRYNTQDLFTQPEKVFTDAKKGAKKVVRNPEYYTNNLIHEAQQGLDYAAQHPQETAIRAGLAAGTGALLSMI